MERQYIGARYVPKFYEGTNGNEWNANHAYERLTIVTYLFNSYTSKKDVPATVGNPMDNPEYWAATGNYNAQVEAYREEVVEYKEEVSDLIKEACSTPEMYGAKGDGATDDTDAFIMLSASNNPVYIPNKHYKITEKIILNNVIKDDGIYSDYACEYAKPLKLDLNGLSEVKSNIPLTQSTGYEQTCAFIRDKYYVITRETPGYSVGVNVYDSSWNFISHTVIDDADMTNANSCCTDGTYLYIDSYSQYHYKYDPSDLTTPLLKVYNTSYDFTCYYNKTLYGVNIRTANVLSFGILSDGLTTLSNVVNLTWNSQTYQSATIFNGQLYVTTIGGDFTVVDLISHKMLYVPYLDQVKEIEALFEVNGKLMAIGHYMSFSGVFCVSGFVDGVDVHNMHYLDADRTVQKFDSDDLSVRPNIYHVTHGKTNSDFPSDDGDFIVTNKFKLFSDGNDIWSFNGTKWVHLGGFNPTTVTITPNKLYASITRSGHLYILFYGLVLTQADTTIQCDLSALYEKLGLPDSTQFRTNILGMTSTGLPMSSDVYGVSLLVSKNYIEFFAKSLLSVDSPMNCGLVGQVFIT